MTKAEADRKGQTGSKHSKQMGKVQGNQGVSSNAADVKKRNGSFVLLFLASLAALISSYAFQYQYQSLKSGDGSELDSSILNDEVRIEGGWRTAAKDILVPAGPCNIPRINAKSVSQQEFLRKYAQHTPVVIAGALSSEADANKDFRRLCERENLLSDWGHATVRLSSANTYSYGTKDVPLRHYVDEMIGPQNLRTLANETYYFFGYNDMEEWKEFFDQYNLPPYQLPNHHHALSFGLAGPGSGVPFHFHGPGFAETLHGRKRWFLTPHHVQPEFNPNKTTLQWYFEDYKRIRQEIDLHECTISPGEIIYFPDRWWHATLNLDTAVFISTFLSP